MCKVSINLFSIQFALFRFYCFPFLSSLCFKAMFKSDFKVELSLFFLAVQSLALECARAVMHTVKQSSRYTVPVCSKKTITLEVAITTGLHINRQSEKPLTP